MKILQVMPNISRSFGGPTESLIGYGKALNESGNSNIKLDIASPVCTVEDLNFHRQKLPSAQYHQFKSFGNHAWKTSLGLWQWLYRHGSDYDCIHIHGLFNPVSSFSARICRIKNYPYIIRPFGTLSRYTFSRTRWFKQPWYYIIDKSNLRSASGIHFTTEAEFEEANRLGIDFDHSKYVIPPPFQKGHATEINNKTDHPTCLFMSRLHPKKNVEGLIRAWKIVIEKFPRAHLSIAGSGQDRYVNHLRQLVRELDLAGSIEFEGFVSGNKKEDLLQSSWIFALPSHQENFGVAVLEAIAAGLPVVISPEVQLCKFVEESNTGEVVEREPQKIANAIIKLFEHKELRAKVNKMGPKAVEENFSLEIVGRQLKRMYLEVATNS